MINNSEERIIVRSDPYGAVGVQRSLAVSLRAREAERDGIGRALGRRRL